VAAFASCELELPTHRSRLRSYQRATGVLWNLTFADAREEVKNGGSGHSQVAITDLGKVPAERLHPRAADSRCRPKADLWRHETGDAKRRLDLRLQMGGQPILSGSKSAAWAPDHDRCSQKAICPMCNSASMNRVHAAPCGAYLLSTALALEPAHREVTSTQSWKWRSVDNRTGKGAAVFPRAYPLSILKPSCATVQTDAGADQPPHPPTSSRTTSRGSAASGDPF
jgi:hypothetical protein